MPAIDICTVPSHHTPGIGVTTVFSARLGAAPNAATAGRTRTITATGSASIRFVMASPAKTTLAGRVYAGARTRPITWSCESRRHPFDVLGQIRPFPIEPGDLLLGGPAIVRGLAGLLPVAIDLRIGLPGEDALEALLLRRDLLLEGLQLRAEGFERLVAAAFFLLFRMERPAPPRPGGARLGGAGCGEAGFARRLRFRSWRLPFHRLGRNGSGRVASLVGGLVVAGG